MTKWILSIVWLFVVWTSIVAPALAAGRFDTAINDSTTSIANNLERPPTAVVGAEGLKDFIIYIVQKVIIPVMIIIGVLLAILGLYDMLSSSKEEWSKKWANYIIWWVLGIIVMMSASFLVDTLTRTTGWVFIYDAQNQLVGTQTAAMIYEKLMFPFVKMGMYLVVGILFVMALFRLISMVTSDKEETKKQAQTIIMYNAFGILVIIFAKAIIETIYGKQAQVVSSTATNLWQIGSGILADKQIPYVYTVINYAMGFIGLFLLVMIILQAIQLLTNPTDEGTQKKLRKNIIYIVIGLAIIGTAYVVTNTLIVK